jgi:hypothetical protein
MANGRQSYIGTSNPATVSRRTVSSLVMMLIDAAVFIAQLDEHSIHVKLGDFGFARFDTNKTQTYVETGIWLAPVGLLL